MSNRTLPPVSGVSGWLRSNRSAPSNSETPTPAPASALAREEIPGAAGLARIHERDRPEPASQRRQVELRGPERLAPARAVLEAAHGREPAEPELRLLQRRDWSRCPP